MQPVAISSFSRAGQHSPPVKLGALVERCRVAAERPQRLTSTVDTHMKKYIAGVPGGLVGGPRA